MDRAPNFIRRSMTFADPEDLDRSVEDGNEGDRFQVRVRLGVGEVDWNERFSTVDPGLLI